MRHLVLAMTCLVPLACSSTPNAPTWPGNALAGSAQDERPYLVQSGDEIGVRFPAYPQWNAVALVQPDGFASLPLLGSLSCRGRTLSDLEREVFQQLSERVRSPRVEIVIQNLHPRLVFVGGEVGNPGAFEIQGAGASMLEVIFARGGPLEETASMGNVIVSRIVDGDRRAWTVDALERLSGSAEPVLLLEGDVILVPGTMVVQADRFVDQYITRMIPGSNLLAGLILAGN